MKILDRYVISTFLKNYLIAFFVLIGMYVTLDMVFNFDELVQVQERANVTSGVDSAIIVIKAAADYYFYQLFSIFVQLSGMIPVAAAAFTLIRFSRFNELSAMLSSGVPLLRVASPIIIVSLVLNGLLLLDQELLIPSIIPKLVRSRQEAGQETTTKDYQIPAMQDERNAVLNVARYRPGPGNVARPPHETRPAPGSRPRELSHDGVRRGSDRLAWPTAPGPPGGRRQR